MARKSHKQIVFLVISLCFTVTCVAFGQGSIDVLEFYCSRASSVGEARNPLEHGLKFTAHTKSYYKRIGRGGTVEKLDSALIEYYYSFGELDSLKIDSISTAKQFDFSINYPNLFAQNYHFEFFPNDTGGPDISIGFEADSSQVDQAEGIVVIDRNDYTLKQLYIFYPDKEGYRRYSRSLRFFLQDGYVFPDSIWVVGSIDHLFSSEDFRIETDILKIEIDR